MKTVNALDTLPLPGQAALAFLKASIVSLLFRILFLGFYLLFAVSIARAPCSEQSARFGLPDIF